jgi:hypothetical protein
MKKDNPPACSRQANVRLPVLPAQAGAGRPACGRQVSFAVKIRINQRYLKATLINLPPINVAVETTFLVYEFALQTPLTLLRKYHIYVRLLQNFSFATTTYKKCTFEKRPFEKRPFRKALAFRNCKSRATDRRFAVTDFCNRLYISRQDCPNDRCRRNANRHRVITYHIRRFVRK